VFSFLKRQFYLSYIQNTLTEHGINTQDNRISERIREHVAARQRQEDDSQGPASVSALWAERKDREKKRIEKIEKTQRELETEIKSQGVMDSLRDYLEGEQQKEVQKQKPQADAQRAPTSSIEISASRSGASSSSSPLASESAKKLSGNEGKKRTGELTIELKRQDAGISELLRGMRDSFVPQKQKEQPKPQARDQEAPPSSQKP